MDDATFVEVANSRNNLIHANRYLFFFQLVRLDMVEQLAAGHLLHDNVHILLCFISFFHLDNVRMRYQLNDLDFFTEEVFFSRSEGSLYDLFGRDHVACLLILALIYGGEFSVSKFWTSKVLFVETEVAGFNSQHPDPVFDDFLILVIVNPRSDQFGLMRNTKTMAFSVLV